jgi:hypothetical protein
MFSLNQKNIVSRRITESGKFQTFSGKIWNKSSASWPICLKFQIYRTFHWLTIHSTGKVFSLEPHSEATRNFPGPEKIPRAYFSLLNMCSKLYPKILTLRASNPQANNPQRHSLDITALDLWFISGLDNPNWSVGRIWKKIGKNFDFLDRILTKTEQKHLKYQNYWTSKLHIGPQKFLFGPRVGHP